LIKLRHSKKIVIILISLQLFAFVIAINTSVKGQTYTIGVRNNDEFVWEIKELDTDRFEYTFGVEPNFVVGDQVRMIIRDITELETLRWQITVEFWDYGMNWDESGDITVLVIYKNPTYYQDYLFVPTPTEQYLQAALENLPSEYYVNGPTIGRRARSDMGVDYTVEKTFGLDGALNSEVYLQEEDGNEVTIVKLERGLLLIPLGYTFLIFALIGIFSITLFVLKKKKFLIYS
jgi:hypothetical protein